MRDAILIKALEAMPPHIMAGHLNITPQAISQWRRVPVRRVIEIEALTGVSRHDLRPDIYPEAA